MRLIYLIESCSLFVFEFVFVFVLVFVPVCLILKPTWLDTVVENTLVFVFVFVFFTCVCLRVCLCLFDVNSSNLTSCSSCCGDHSGLCVCLFPLCVSVCLSLPI